MKDIEYEEAVEILMEKVKGYGFAWSNEVNYDDFTEDENFLYLEIEGTEVIWGAVQGTWKFLRCKEYRRSKLW